MNPLTIWRSGNGWGLSFFLPWAISFTWSSRSTFGGSMGATSCPKSSRMTCFGIKYFFHSYYFFESPTLPHFSIDLGGRDDFFSQKFSSKNLKVDVWAQRSGAHLGFFGRRAPLHLSFHHDLVRRLLPHLSHLLRTFVLHVLVVIPCVLWMSLSCSPYVSHPKYVRTVTFPTSALLPHSSQISTVSEKTFNLKKNDLYITFNTGEWAAKKKTRFTKWKKGSCGPWPSCTTTSQIRKCMTTPPGITHTRHSKPWIASTGRGSTCCTTIFRIAIWCTISSSPRSRTTTWEGPPMHWKIIWPRTICCISIGRFFWDFFFWKETKYRNWDFFWKEKKKKKTCLRSSDFFRSKATISGWGSTGICTTLGRGRCWSRRTGAGSAGTPMSVSRSLTPTYEGSKSSKSV